MLIFLICIVITVLVVTIINEYLNKVNHLLFRVPHLSENQIKLLGFELIEYQKGISFKYYRYKYKNIIFVVKRSRYSFFTYIGDVTIEKHNKQICRYQDLTMDFKTGLYRDYIRIRYPKTLAHIIKYQSKRTKVKSKLEEFMKKEDIKKY